MSKLFMALGLICIPSICMAADPTTTSELFDQAVSAAKVGDWRVLAGVICIGLVWLARWGVGKIPGKVGAWFNTDRGGAVMALIVGVLGSVAHMLSSKDPFSMKFIMDGAVMAVTAAGGFTVFNKLFKPSDKASPAAPTSDSSTPA